MTPAADKITPPSSKTSNRATAKRVLLPDFAREIAVHAAYLRGEGWYPAIAMAMRKQGWRGSDGFDVFQFAYGALCSDAPGGFDGYYKMIQPYSVQLAALMGRGKMVSDSSVSRYFQHPTPDETDRAVRNLVVDSAAQGLTQGGSSVTVKDNRGSGFHFLDLDFTVDAFRQRRLIESREYPDPERRLTDVALPGFTGAKRGEVAIARGLLYHSGSGHWLGAWVYPGSGDFRDQVQRAAESMILLSEKTGIAKGRMVLRMDGAGGNGACIAIASSAGFPVITRLARYELFGNPGLQAALNKAEWEVMPRSEEGLARYAADMGSIVLPTNAPDLPLLPADIKVRLIVTRFRASSAKVMAGARIGEWIYEMFGTSLPPDGWRAAEVAQEYFGRAGGENGIAMHRRELPLGYLFSCNRAGLQMINNLGLFLWNNRLNIGFKLRGAPNPEPRPEPRSIQIAADLPPPFPEALPAAPRPAPDESASDATSGASPAASSPLPDGERSAPAPAGDPATEAEGLSVADLLAELDVAAALERQPNMTWRMDRLCFVCPKGQALTFHGARRRKQAFFATFRALVRVCGRCPGRSECTDSASPRFVKQIDVHLPKSLFEQLQRAQADPKRIPPSRSRHIPLGAPAPPGPLRLAPPSEFPRMLRKSLEDFCQRISVEVKVKPSVSLQAGPTIDEIYQARRQRRLPWAQRFKKNHLQGKAEVTIHVQDSREAAPLIPRGRPWRAMPYDLQINSAFRISGS